MCQLRFLTTEIQRSGKVRVAGMPIDARRAELFKYVKISKSVQSNS